MSPTDQPAAPGSPGATTLRQKVLLVGFGLALFFLGLALVEAAMTLLGLGDAVLYDDPFVGFAPGKELFEKKTLPDGEIVFATRPEKLAFFNAQRFPAEKGADTYRIFTLGGSTTAGRPYDDKVAFARWLGLYLNELDPSRDWQTINAGAISYASYRVVLLMKELVRYEPDLFVVYTGHNEFLEERSYSGIINQNPVLKRLRFWLNSRRFYATARHAWLGLREPSEKAEAAPTGDLEGEVNARLDGWTGLELYHKDKELEESISQHFAHNLQRMARVAEAHGIDLIFVQPVSNLKDFSPFKSEHPASLSEDQTADFAAFLAKSRSFSESDDPESALASLDQALAIDPEHAEAHFLVGRAHLARQDFENAEAAFVRAKDLDVAPLRALERFKKDLVEIAEKEEVELIDLPTLLAAESRQRFGHPILGNEFLLDHVHPDLPTHSLIAEQVITILTAKGIARPDPSWNDTKRQAVYDRLVSGIDRSYYAERDLNLAKVLGWAGKLEEAEAPLARAAAELTGNPEVHLHLGIVYQKAGRYVEAASELEKALALNPDSPEARFNLGVVLGHLGRDQDGIVALEEATRLRPGYPEAHYNLGVLLRQRGFLERAVGALERARDLRPEATEVHNQLGLAYRSLGRLDEAATTFERGLTIDQKQATLRTGLGITYGMQGRFDDAVRELERVLATHPESAEARYNLGVVYSQEGADAQALAAFLATVEADPDHAEAHNNLGIRFAGQGDLETARQHLLRAIEVDPDYADAFFNLGVVFDQAGLRTEAAEVLERAVELAPDNPRFHFALAMMHHADGRAEAASHHFAIARRGGIETPPEVLRQLSPSQ